MNRKLLTIAIALVILAIVVAPVAATMPPKCPLPPAKPYDSIWTLMQDLQKQITTLTTKVNTIQLTPGPRGPTGPKGDTGVAGPQGPAGTCTNCVCPSGQFVTGFDSAGKLVCGAPPVAGGGTPLPAIVPICQAGTPFDASKYAQNTVQSDPMVFTCNWDGNGRVYISGDKTSLTGVYADDGFTINVQPKGVMFDAPEHWAHQHPVVELTSGMTPGSNTFTLIIQD
jgi:hypothetical protein